MLVLLFCFDQEIKCLHLWGIHTYQHCLTIIQIFFVAFLLMLHCRFSSIIFVIRKVFFWETSSMKFHLWEFINHSTSEMYYKSNIINLKRCLLFCTLPADFHEIILVYVIWMIHSNLLKSEFITYFLDKIVKFNKISLGTAYLCIKNKRDT